MRDVADCFRICRGQGEDLRLNISAGILIFGVFGILVAVAVIRSAYRNKKQMEPPKPERVESDNRDPDVWQEPDMTVVIVLSIVLMSLFILAPYVANSTITRHLQWYQEHMVPVMVQADQCDQAVRHHEAGIRYDALSSVDSRRLGHFVLVGSNGNIYYSEIFGETGKKLKELYPGLEKTTDQIPVKSSEVTVLRQKTESGEAFIALRRSSSGGWILYIAPEETVIQKL